MAATGKGWHLWREIWWIGDVWERRAHCLSLCSSSLNLLWLIGTLEPCDRYMEGSIMKVAIKSWSRAREKLPDIWQTQPWWPVAPGYSNNFWNVFIHHHPKARLWRVDVDFSYLLTPTCFLLSIFPTPALSLYHFYPGYCHCLAPDLPASS